MVWTEQGHYVSDMATMDVLDRGRSSFDRREWSAAYEELTAADRRNALDAEDLERLATAACLLGRDEESDRLWGRAHHAYLERGEPERAARCAFWLAFGLMDRGESARAGGWLARAGRLLGDVQEECVEHGYLLLPVALRAIFGGDNQRALDTFSEAAAIAERFGDADLAALARHGQGRALIRLGDLDAGVGLLDEAMAAVEAGEISTLVAGDIYCSVIEACQEIFDLRRAQEWTAALSRWCDSQPELVPHRGLCMVRRSELLQLHGDWGGAMQEAERACVHLTRPPARPAAGAAYYQQAQLYRLRGTFDEAERAYRQAGRHGRKAMPGMAQLRLAQGRVDAAVASIRRALDEAEDRRVRSQLLPAYCDIVLAAGDVEAARSGADDLAAIAGELDAPLLHAFAARARGAVRLAGGDARGALEELREACRELQELDAPYEVARTRELVGVACHRLGDHDSGEIETEAARAVFRELDAEPDLARLSDDRASGAGVNGESHGLTPRELDVLRLVATGDTNKGIATRLFISERTVERHLSNIFKKLNVATRAAATAYAYEHGLARP